MSTPPPSDARHGEPGEHVDPSDSGDAGQRGHPVDPADPTDFFEPAHEVGAAGAEEQVDAGPHDPWPRRVGIVMAVGLGVGILAAFAAGATGASGQVGAVLVLLVLSLAAGVGALLALVSSVVDEFRGRDVTRRRPVLGIVLFVVAAMLMAMTVAAAA